MPDKRRARIKKPRFSLHSARPVVWARHATVFVAECHANRHACKTPFTLSLSLSLSFSGSTSSLCVRSLSTNLKEQKPTSFHVHRGHQALGIMTMRTTRRTNDVREGKRLFPLPFTEHEMDFQSEFACLRLLCALPVPVIPDEQTGSNLRAITQRDELTDNRPRPFSLPLQSKSPFSSLPPPSLLPFPLRGDSSAH